MASRLVEAAAILAVFTALLIGMIIFFYKPLSGLDEPNTPIPLLFGTVTSVDDVMNVSQGGSINLNFTLASNDSQEIKVSIENLTLDELSNASSLKKGAFTYSFITNQLTLEPYCSNSTLLTIGFSDNAPVGDYWMVVGLSERPPVPTTVLTFTLNVTPKQ